MRSQYRVWLVWCVALGTLLAAGGAWGAGTLTPLGSPDAAIQIRDQIAAGERNELAVLPGEAAVPQPDVGAPRTADGHHAVRQLAP